jgi:hypothetical protein
MDQHGKTIKITVEYTGKTPFAEEVHGNLTFHHIKLAAMKAFELEPSAASSYVLQDGGTDLPDQAHVDSLGRAVLLLHLTLKEEPVKG